MISEDNLYTIRILQKNSDFERVSIIDAEGDRGQEVIGILAASYDMTALSRMLFEDIYGGKGFSMILTKEGDVISYDAGSSTGGRALESIGNNLFGKYESELENNPAAAKVNGWMVCYSIPSKSARSVYQFINQYEFVIFMKNVASVNHVEAKVREIAEHISNLQIPELKENSLTVSMGISCAPEHGETYLDLYHHADEALYETKRNRRNGYTVGYTVYGKREIEHRETFDFKQ